jgi:hypothetical protein
MFSRSDDGGETWLDPAAQVSDTAPNAVYFPAIDLLPDGSIAVVWAEMQFGPNYNSEIRFSRSMDGGFTWSASVVVHPLNPSVDMIRPSVTTAGGRFLISYWEEVAYPNAKPKIVYTDDLGANWSAPVSVTSMQGPYDGSAPCVAYNEDRGEIGLVMPTAGGAIYYFKSSNLGSTWSAGVQVSDAAASSIDYPDLACYGGNDYVVWGDNRTGQYDVNIWISRSADGVNFLPSVLVNEDIAGNQYEPHISADPSGNLHVCWIWNQPFQSNIDLYYSVSEDGDAWLPQSPRVNDVPYIVQPYVAWTSDIIADTENKAHVFWNDGRTTYYYDNIYYSRTTDISDAGGARRDRLAGKILSGRGEFYSAAQPGPDPRIRLILSEGIRDLTIDLVAPSGRRVRSLWSGAAPAGRLEFDLGGASGGVYFIRLSDGVETAGRRVVILR